MAASTEDDDEPVDPSDELIFTGLGGCQEVGRSCHILQYKGKTVMVGSSPLDTQDSFSDICSS
jgi:cleavage and polyadenylation specificity factor subunit 3